MNGPDPHPPTDTPGAPESPGAPEGAAATDPNPAQAAEEFDLGESVILVVDDNQQNVELIQAYLDALPCKVLTAYDGMDAIEIVEDPDKPTPDLILLDVMMPRMSGFDVCRKLKDDPKTRTIPIMMVTALNELGDIERGVESGTDDFVTKPVNKLELITRVKSLLRVRHLKRELDRTEAIEAQIERFAPGFRDRILARHATPPSALEALNPNFVGGAITGGAATLAQLVARPALRLDPYSTPDPRLFLCSASTPPGGGVHGGRIVAEGPPSALIAEHVPSHVVEIRLDGDGRVPPELAELGEAAERAETLSDRFLLYADHGEELIGEAYRRAPDRRALVRRATLEDVFLRITGRRLEQ